MVKWLAIGLIGSLILITIPMSLSAQAMGSEDTGMGVIFASNTFLESGINFSNSPNDNDKIIFTGTKTQLGNTGGVLGINTLCGLSPVPTGTPAPTPTGTLTPAPTGTPCSPFDIYLHIVVEASWSGGSHTAMEIDTSYGTGAASNAGRQLGSIVIPCSIDTPSSGSCSLDTYLTINSTDIAFRSDWPQAYFKWVYPWWDGGSGVTFVINYLVTFADEDLSPSMGDCSSQFLTGSTPIASGTVDAMNSQGINILAHSDLGLHIGDWIEVVTSGGPWRLNGAGDPRWDMATRTDFKTWGELSGTGVSQCATYPGMGSYVRAYIQVTSTNNISFRVNANEFVLNSGSLGYAVYKATYSPFPANGCAEQYVLQNNIGSVTVSANATNGVMFVPAVDLNTLGYPIGPTEGPQTRYLAIQTSGTYYTVTGGGSGTGALKDVGNDGAWASMSDYPPASCISKLDMIGHYIDYIPYTGGSVNYLARVDTLNYTGQPGQLTFTFYIATKIQVQAPPSSIPGSGICNTYFTHGSTLIHSYTVTAQYEAGAVMTLDTNKYYALEVTGGPWLNNGTNPSYAMAISSDDGANWSEIYKFSSQLCSQSADGNHVLTYIKPLTGRVYRIRVYDPDLSYTDGNTGSLSLNVYEATPTGAVTQWDTCGSSYTLLETNSTDTARQVPANVEIGVPFGDNTIGSNLTLTPGDKYALDVDPAHGWKELLTPLVLRFQYQISVDNGSNWIDIDDSSYAVPGLLCVMHTTAGEASPYRIYFTAQDGAYRIRAHDQDGNFNNNIDYMIYRLYKVSPGSGTPPGSMPPTTPLNNWPDNPGVWGPGCTDVCNRPSSVFTTFPISFSLLGSLISFAVPIPDIAGWLEYGRCALQHYISWCQEDTQAILNLPSALQDREPFGTFIELSTTIKNVQNIINSYDLTGGSGSEIGPNTSSLWGPVIGGSGSGNPPDPLLSNLPASSFWNGGPLNLTIGGDVSSTDEDYINQCTISYDKYIGSPAHTMCYTFYIIRNLVGYLQKLQWLIDAAAALMIVTYIMNRWVGAGGPPA